jgi:glycosyltransferase involved in cell wall biosynthesis
VYAGAIHPRKNLMNLLKAFSIFKKRQQTNMKLMLTEDWPGNMDLLPKA